MSKQIERDGASRPDSRNLPTVRERLSRPRNEAIYGLATNLLYTFYRLGSDVETTEAEHRSLLDIPRWTGLETERERQIALDTAERRGRINDQFILTKAQTTLDSWFFDRMIGYTPQRIIEGTFTPETYGEVSQETQEAVKQRGDTMAEVISIAQFYMDNPLLPVPDPDKIEVLDLGHDLRYGFFRGKPREIIVQPDTFLVVMGGLYTGGAEDITIRKDPSTPDASGHVLFSGISRDLYNPRTTYKLGRLNINALRKGEHPISSDFVVHLGNKVWLDTEANWYLSGLALHPGSHMAIKPPRYKKLSGIFTEVLEVSETSSFVSPNVTVITKSSISGKAFVYATVNEVKIDHKQES